MSRDDYDSREEVETPIARLAQLACHWNSFDYRHPTSFGQCYYRDHQSELPARIAFRVTSKIDSRTILDSGGADQLIGRGDMLYTGTT